MSTTRLKVYGKLIFHCLGPNWFMQLTSLHITLNSYVILLKVVPYPLPISESPGELNNTSAQEE